MSPDDLPAELLKVCPSAEFRWRKHRARWVSEEAGAFNDVAVFAHHAVESYASGQTEEFPNLFELLEGLIREGDPRVVELVTIGLIEDIQNIASHEPFGYHVFEPWLGRKTTREWKKVEAIWAGKSSLAEVVADENERKP